MKNVVKISDGINAEIVEGGNILISSKSTTILLDSYGELLYVKKEKEVKKHSKIQIECSKGTEELEVIISDLLHELGVPSNLLGYGYLKTAIKLVYNNKDGYYARAYVKKLYPEVARIHNTTYIRVERAIRNVIEIVWKRGNTNLLDEMFCSIISTDRGKATNAEFISTVVERLKNT